MRSDIERRLAALEAGRKGCAVCRDWPGSAMCVQPESGALELFPLEGGTWPVDDPHCWACGRRPMRVHILGAERAKHMKELLKPSRKDA
jgi:hypothetical protein